MAVNWKKVEELVAQGKGTEMNTKYAHNVYDESTQTSNFRNYDKGKNIKA